MPQQGNQYVVEGGDNLFSIAEKLYGDQRMFAEVMRLNRLSSGVIRPGMVLNLPRQKPSSQISIAKGLVEQLGAENKFVQTNNRLPTPAEMQQQISGQATQLSQAQQLQREQMGEQRWEQYQKRVGIDYANNPTYTAPATSGWTPEMKAAYGARYSGEALNITKGEKIANASAKMVRGINTSVGNVARVIGKSDMVSGGLLAGVSMAPLGPQAAAIGVGGGVIGGAISDIAKGVGRWWNEPANKQDASTPITPQAITQSLPRTPFVPQRPIGGAPVTGIATQTIPAAVTSPPQTYQDVITYSQGELTAEQESLTQKIQAAAAYLENPTLSAPVFVTQDDVNKFISMYNINPNASPEMADVYNQLNTLPLQVALPLTADEAYADIYTLLNNVGTGYQMPILMQIQNARAGESEGGGGGNAKTIGAGSGVTWRP